MKKQVFCNHPTGMAAFPTGGTLKKSPDALQAKGGAIMKKALSLTLSALLALGTMTSAFAATSTSLSISHKPSEEKKIILGADDDENYTFQNNGPKMEPGTDYVFPIDGVQGIDITRDGKKDKITEAKDGTGNLDADDLFDLVDDSKATLKVSASYGKEYLSALKLVKRAGEYELNISTKDTLSTKDGEFGFELELKARGSGSDFTTRKLTVKKAKIGFDVAEGKGDASSSMNIKADGTILDTDKMDACEDYEFTWGDDEIAKFVVDIDDNDGKKNLAYTTAPNDDLIDANPKANMNFFTLKARPTFNKLGQMTIYADGDVFKYIYEITTDGKLKELNAKYDKNEEGFVFRTRTLGSYVVSDRELTAYEEEVDEKPAEKPEEKPAGESDKPAGETSTQKPDDGRHNPETGANDMVNVAAALGAVSIAGVGALTLRKRK